MILSSRSWWAAILWASWEPEPTQDPFQGGISPAPHMDAAANLSTLALLGPLINTWFITQSASCKGPKKTERKSRGENRANGRKPK